MGYDITHKTLKTSVKVTVFGPFGGFLDLTRLLGGVVGSDGFLNAPSIYAGYFEAPGASMYYNITRKTLKTSAKVTVFDQK